MIKPSQPIGHSMTPKYEFILSSTIGTVRRQNEPIKLTTVCKAKDKPATSKWTCHPLSLCQGQDS